MSAPLREGCGSVRSFEEVLCSLRCRWNIKSKRIGAGRRCRPAFRISLVAPVGPSGTPWRQCELANQQLGQNSCCLNGATGQCNQDGYLDRSLLAVGHLASRAAVGASSYAYIKQEIDRGHPVGVRIGWHQDGGHFVLITGYDESDGVQTIWVEDPWWGASSYELGAFTTAYENGAGQWTHTYPIA